MIEGAVLGAALRGRGDAAHTAAGPDLARGHILEEGVVVNHPKDRGLQHVPDLDLEDGAFPLEIGPTSETAPHERVAVSPIKRAKATLLSISRVFDILRICSEIM